ncbi:MAG: hypothetical protein FWF69_01130 [Firmicutes bacterium]|nr:hypothetical protein [Bacillota bacterium]
MRVFTCILLLVTLLAAAFLGYCYVNARMVIEGVSASQVAAADALGTYNQVKNQIAQGTFLGTVYRDANYVMPEGYTFLTLTVRMANHGILPQDWIRIELTPDAADIALLYNERTPTLAGMSRADFYATLLTHTGAHTSRTVKITYYVLGMPFSVSYQMP